MKHCVTKTENKSDIKRQNEKNLIFERNVVVVKEKCDNDLNDCLSEKKENKKEKIEKNSAKEV